MTKFIAGFAFAFASMMTWAAYSENAADRIGPWPTSVSNYIMAIAHGRDDKSNINMLHVEPDGSVICSKVMR